MYNVSHRSLSPSKIFHVKQEMQLMQILRQARPQKSITKQTTQSSELGHELLAQFRNITSLHICQQL